MTFTLRKFWHCEFTEEGNKIRIRKLTFATADKIRELAERGGVTLKLTPDQYAKLKG